ncbi:MAG: hypothetical protein ABI947_19920 [Chloroflexota bacterium]
MGVKNRYLHRQLDGDENRTEDKLKFGEKDAELCRSALDALEEFVTRYSGFIMRHNATDRLFAGYLGADDTSWVFGGGSGFFVDERSEVQYRDSFTIRRVHPNLWVIETLHDLPTHQEFKTLDEAVDSVWLAYGLPIGLEFLAQTIRDLGFEAEIRENGTLLVIGRSRQRNDPDGFERKGVVRRARLQYFLLTLKGKPYTQRKVSLINNDEDLNNFSNICTLLMPDFAI